MPLGDFDEYPKLRSGDPCFYEAFGLGALPGKVMSISGKPGLPSSTQRVTVRLTIRKPKGDYRPGDVVMTYGFRVGPKETFGYKSRNYTYNLIPDHLGGE